MGLACGEVAARALLVGNLLVTGALVGVVWTIQLVVYPQFARVPRRAFARFHAGHTRRITWVVGPLMVAELALAGALVLRPPAGAAGLARIAAALVVVCWASTGLVQVPLHRILGRRLEPRALRRLVTSNWLRTAAWTARALLLAAIAV